MATTWWTTTQRTSWLAVGLVVVGCKGNPEPDFVASYVTSYCQYTVDCADPVEVVFDGPPTVEDCRAVVGPELAAQAEGCKLERDAADLCLSDLDGLPCPAEGAPEDAVPASCDPGLVWKKCDDVTAGDEAADEDAIEG